jgi:hypothetical protein
LDGVFCKKGELDFGTWNVRCVYRVSLFTRRGETGVDEVIILKGILKKLGGMMSLRVGSSAGLLWTRLRTFGFDKRLEIFY